MAAFPVVLLEYNRVAHQLVRRRPENRGDVLNTICDDMALIRVKDHPVKYVKMSDSPALHYLNLFDYENKNDHFQSCPFLALRMPERPSEIPIYRERFVNIASQTVFDCFKRHIKEYARDTIDLLPLIEKLARVMDILKLHHRPFLMRYSLKAVFREVMELYRDSQPRDFVLLLRIFDSLCFLPELKQYAVEYFLFDLSDARHLRRFLDTAVQRRFSFWTMWERRACVNIVPYCPVTSAYFSGRLNHLRVLLDYGFQQTHQRLSTLEKIRDDNIHHNLEEYLWLKSALIKKEEVTSRSSIIAEVVLFIYILCNSQLLVQEQKVKGFQLLWQTRKEPLVTKAELIYAMKKGFSEPNVVQTMHVQLAQFMSFIDFYEHILPKWEWKVLQPRSLSHLCRCSIREALNDNWEMPFGIKKLPMPDKMKKFILLRNEL